MKVFERRSKLLGKAFHCLMEFSADLANLDFIRARHLISEFSLTSSEQILVLKSIKKIKESAHCMKLLNSDSTHILIESEWLDEFGDVLRPDRLDFNLIKKTANIIDFKWKFSNDYKNFYLDQLLKYKKVIELNHPEIIVKSFLVTGNAQIFYVQGNQLLHLD